MAMLIIRSYFAKKVRKTTPKYAQEDVAINPTMAPPSACPTGLGMRLTVRRKLSAGQTAVSQS